MPTLVALEQLTDDELCTLAQQGDRSALEVIINRYRRFARSTARRFYLTGGDRDDVEQEALIGLYKAVRDYRVDAAAGFRSFAELCITRQILSAVKAAGRRKHHALNTSASLHAPVGSSADGGEERTLGETLEGDTSQNPEHRIVHRESVEDLLEVLRERFTDFELDVLSRQRAGQSYVEMAAELGRSTKAIDNALQRCKRKLARLLEEQPHLRVG